MASQIIANSSSYTHKTVMLGIIITSMAEVVGGPSWSERPSGVPLDDISCPSDFHWTIYSDKVCRIEIERSASWCQHTVQ